MVHRPRVRTLVVLVLFGLTPGHAAARQPPASVGVRRAECVPFGTLPAGLRPKADRLLTRMLDSEALFTVVGGLKPASDGFWHERCPADRTTTAGIEEARTVLSRVTCGGDLVAGVFVFGRAFRGERTASAFVAHRPRLREVIRRHAGLFAGLGIAPDTHPQRVFERIDRGPTSPRWRAFGLIFGYPEYAVDFFVEAGERQRETGKFVKREFRSIPTFGGGREFVYAVPMGHSDRAEDLQLKERAAPILAEYKRRRGQYVGPNKPGAAYLLRDWFDNGYGFCFVPNVSRRANPVATRGPVFAVPHYPPGPAPCLYWGRPVLTPLWGWRRPCGGWRPGLPPASLAVNESQ